METARRSNIIDGNSQKEEHNRWEQLGEGTLLAGDNQEEEHY